MSEQWHYEQKGESYIKVDTLHKIRTLESELAAVTKERDRLAEALKQIQGVGLVAVDAFDELDRIDEIVDEALQSLNQTTEP